MQVMRAHSLFAGLGPSKNESSVEIRSECRDHGDFRFEMSHPVDRRRPSGHATDSVIPEHTGWTLAFTMTMILRTKIMLTSHIRLVSEIGIDMNIDRHTDFESMLAVMSNTAW
jgi:hypothetical protein